MTFIDWLIVPSPSLLMIQSIHQSISQSIYWSFNQLMHYSHTQLLIHFLTPPITMLFPYAATPLRNTIIIIMRFVLLIFWSKHSFLPTMLAINLISKPQNRKTFFLRYRNWIYRAVRHYSYTNSMSVLHDNRGDSSTPHFFSINSLKGYHRLTPKKWIRGKL